MARYPGAVWRPIAKNYSKGGNRCDTVQFHTASDGPSTKSLFGWFNGGAHASSHFYVAGDGTVEQYVDTADRAWAAFSSNSHAISIETHDGGNNVNPWNTQQLAALVALADWCCRTHGIKRTICSSDTSGGIGWHEQFRSWNHNAHDCPGSVREAQIRDVIVPRLQAPVQVDWNAVRRLAAGALASTLSGLGTLDGSSPPSLAVAAVQQALNMLGAAVVVNGTYDQATIDAVVHWQGQINAMFPGKLHDFPGAFHDGTRFFTVCALQNIRNGNA
jgi:N-acetyl-anhydromuramyl-L-alanine amidase AmpD